MENKKIMIKFGLVAISHNRRKIASGMFNREGKTVFHYIKMVFEQNKSTTPSNHKNTPWQNRSIKKGLRVQSLFLFRDLSSKNLREADFQHLVKPGLHLYHPE